MSLLVNSPRTPVFCSAVPQPSTLCLDLCVGETQILVAQVPPQGVLIREHAGPVINKLSLLAALVRPEREFFIDNLLVRIHYIIVMIRWTGLAPWEFEFPTYALQVSCVHTWEQQGKR